MSMPAQVSGAWAEIARHGWAGIPLWPLRRAGQRMVCACGAGGGCHSPGKHPHAALAPHGLDDASADPWRFDRWAEHTDAAAVVCGPSRLVVADIDGVDGLAWWEAAERSATYTVLTGRTYGLHLYFTLPAELDGDEAWLRPVKLDDGVDVRAGRAYVVAAGSRHASGRTYRILTPGPRGRPAQAPAWLLERLQSVSAGGERAQTADGDVPDIFEGSRNTWLTSVGGLLRMRGVGETGIVEALRAIDRAQCRPPLGDDEVARIARSVVRYQGGHQPSDIADRVKPAEKVKPAESSGLAARDRQPAAGRPGGIAAIDARSEGEWEQEGRA